MATTIIIGDNDDKTMMVPECPNAATCNWFETSNMYSGYCTNRNSMVCQRHKADVFSSEKIKALIK